MNRRALTWALILGLSIISGCECIAGNCGDCPLPGCDTCEDSACRSNTSCPCAAYASCPCDSRPVAETRSSEEIVVALKSGDRAARERAIDSLAKRGTEVLPQIESLLSDPDATVRFSALEVLVRLRHDAWPTVYHVKYRLQDPDPGVRAEAATVIGLTGRCAAEAIPQLICALNDSSPTVRYRAAVAFQRMDTLGEPGRNELEKHSRCDREPRVREACRCALHKLDEAICHQPVVYHG